MSDDNVRLWEQELENSIHNANIVSRDYGVPSINGELVYREAESLGIDQLRVKRLVVAAQEDLRWDSLVNTLEYGGMSPGNAEWAAEKICHDILAGRIRRSAVQQQMKDKKIDVVDCGSCSESRWRLGLGFSIIDPC